VTFSNGPRRHVFLDLVKGKGLPLDRLQGALEAVTPGRIEEYRYSLPEAWGREDAATERMIAYIQQLRANASTAIQQITVALQ
jgi:uncharacterized protein YbjQ (UPF0145 family)